MLRQRRNQRVKISEALKKIDEENTRQKVQIGIDTSAQLYQEIEKFVQELKEYSNREHTHEDI